MPGAFQGVKIVELGSLNSAKYCGKLFADNGAIVTRLELIRGEERQLSSGTSGAEFENWINSNKRCVSVNADVPQDIAEVVRSLSDFDLLIHGSDENGTYPLSDEIESFGSKISSVKISWFGETGPYKNYLAGEAVGRALSGLCLWVGSEEGPPVLATEGQSELIGGIASFIPAVAALFSGKHRPRHFTSSIHESLVNVGELATIRGFHNENFGGRAGINKFGRHHPSSIYKTADGLLGIATVTAAQWRGLCAMLGLEHLITDPRFSNSLRRVQNADALDELISPVFQREPADHWFTEGLKRKLPVALVPTMQELAKQIVHTERRTFVPIGDKGSPVLGPVVPFRLKDNLVDNSGFLALARRLETADSILATLPSGQAEKGDRKPLESVRIVDLTMGWAGPFATRLLADLGAEIIKVEACRYPDWWRGSEKTDAFYREKLYEKSPTFLAMNRNKRGITLDLTIPEGRMLLNELVAKSDAVIENYSRDVPDKLGLLYEDLRRVNENLVMVSMSAFGDGNAWSKCRAYGSTMEQASGMPTLIGGPHHPPTMTAHGYGDPIGGFYAAAALLSALYHKQRTGEGQLVDLSLVECLIQLIASDFIWASVKGEAPPRIGNRHRKHAPQGLYPCKGEDRWIAISITSDLQWEALVTAMDSPRALLIDKHGQYEGRREDADLIDEAIRDWSRNQDADQLMRTLQSLGIPAGVARSPVEVLSDEHLKARNFWQTVNRKFVGDHILASSPFREDGRPYPVRRPAPTLGEHTHEVLEEILGVTPNEIEELRRLGVIGENAKLKDS